MIGVSASDVEGFSARSLDDKVAYLDGSILRAVEYVDLCIVAHQNGTAEVAIYYEWLLDAYPKLTAMLATVSQDVSHIEERSRKALWNAIVSLSIAQLSMLGDVLTKLRSLIHGVTP